MKLGAIIAVTCLGVLGASAAAPKPLISESYLHTSGTKIVDGSGNALRLKGVNIGCWLYPEPWMWGTFYFGNYEAGAGETDVLSNFLSANLTPDQVATFWDTYRTNFVTDADIAYMAAHGWNCVRVPMDFRLFVDPTTGNPVTSNFKYIDGLVGYCKNHGVHIILDMHNVPGSPYYYNSGNVFDSTSNQAILNTAWLNVATYYAGEPTIAGYDLINEPVANGDPNFRPYLVSLTNLIRTVDPNHIIFVEGDWWASSLDVLGAPWDSNMVFSDHNYGSTLPNNLPHDETLATQYNIPLWMGEFGYNSNNWNVQQMNLLNQTNVINGEAIQAQWSLWSWKANAIWTPATFNTYGPFQTVLNALNSGGTLTSGQIEAGFTDLASAVAYNANNINKSVVDSLTRLHWSVTTAPYAAQSIPGQVTAVRYDYGPEGLAYHNSISSNTSGMGSGFTAWNNGWLMRNDGVDITTYSESGEAQYAVGWNNAGEWEQYTVNVTPGTYDITFKYSGPGGSEIHLTVNNENVTGPIWMPKGPNNGDWNTYGTYTVHGVPITASGMAALRVHCVEPGYNLAWMKFTPSVG
jgi:aryl-phospho-beta-D-glucosidase BglC (GH1 family)